MRTSLIAAAAFAALTTDAGADLSADGRVTVTATRTPLAVEDSTAPVIIITRDEILRTATFDVAEVLRLQAGIEIGRAGGPGQQAALFIRGTNSNHTQVMVDGVRVNPGTLGGAAVQNLRPHDIERIEVVKGPRSSLYGTEAIGGVVNIITRRPQAPFEASAHAGAGRHGTREAGAALGGKSGAWHAGVTVDHVETDGFAPRRDADVARGHDNTTFTARAGVEGGGHALELRHRDARGNTEYLDFFLAPVDQDFVNAVTALEVTSRLGAAVRTTLLVSRAADEISQSQSPDHAITRRTAYDLQFDFDAGAAHAYSAGILHTREDTRAEVFGTAFNERPDATGVFGQYRYDAGANRALVALRHTDHDAFGGHATWNVEFGRDLTDRWSVVAGAGTAFRAPDSTERFGFGGNPDLDPERSRNVELGLRGRIDGRQRIEWAVFDNRIRDLVSFDPDTFALVNLDRARIRGTEITYSFTHGRWQFRQGLVFQNPEDALTGDQLPRRARRSAQTALAFDAGRAVTLGMDVVAQGARPDSAFSDDTIGGYALVNASAQWAPSANWAFDARLENVLDRDYETAFGYRQPGRSLFVRARWRM